MKKSKLLKEIASVKIYKSFRDALNGVSDTVTKQHFATVKRSVKEAKAQKAKAKAAMAKGMTADNR
jgi:hypothetical protein